MALSDKITILQKINFDDLYNTFLGLDKRRQVLIGAAAGLVLLFLLFLPASCVSQKLNERENEYVEYLDKASEFFGMIAEYEKLQKNFSKVEKSFQNLGSDPLRTVVYKLGEDFGIEASKIQLETLKSTASSEIFQEVGKEVSMRNVQVDVVIKFIEKLENYEEVPLLIKKVNMKADKNDKRLLRQVSFTVSTIRPNKS